MSDDLLLESLIYIYHYFYSTIWRCTKVLQIADKKLRCILSTIANAFTIFVCQKLKMYMFIFYYYHNVLQKPICAFHAHLILYYIVSQHCQGKEEEKKSYFCYCIAVFVWRWLLVKSEFTIGLNPLLAPRFSIHSGKRIQCVMLMLILVFDSFYFAQHLFPCLNCDVHKKWINVIFCCMENKGGKSKRYYFTECIRMECHWIAFCLNAKWKKK